MTDFQLFFFDENSAIVASREVSHDADDDAVTEAYKVVPSRHVVEVWSGSRMVARVPCPQPASSFTYDVPEAPGSAVRVEDHSVYSGLGAFGDEVG